MRVGEWQHLSDGSAIVVCPPRRVENDEFTVQFLGRGYRPPREFTVMVQNQGTVATIEFARSQRPWAARQKGIRLIRAGRAQEQGGEPCR